MDEGVDAFEDFIGFSVPVAAFPPAFNHTSVVTACSEEPTELGHSG